MKYLKIFTDFLEVMDPLTDEEAGRLYRAMLAYAKDGSEPELSGNERFLWTVAKQHIDREAATYENMVNARREAGRKSGEVRREQKEQTGTTMSKTNQDKDKEKDNDKDKDKERVCMSAAGAASRPRTAPPSLEEIESYCRERGNQVNPRRFHAFYTANGWRIGKVPMKDWKAAVRGWETNGLDEARPAPVKEPSSRDNFLAVLEMARMEEAKQV